MEQQRNRAQAAEEEVGQLRQALDAVKRELRARDGVGDVHMQLTYLELDDRGFLGIVIQLDTTLDCASIGFIFSEKALQFLL